MLFCKDPSHSPKQQDPMNNDKQHGPSQNAKQIISLSIGTSDPSRLWRQYVTIIVSIGIMFIIIVIISTLFW